MPWANDGGNTWNAVRCAPLDPNPKAPGEACTVEMRATSGVDDCALGAMCWAVDPMTLQGTCVALCTGSQDAPTCDAPNERCSITHDGILPLCLVQCDPLLQDCPGGAPCVLDMAGDGFTCLLGPVSGGTAGNSCTSPAECDAGLMCMDAGVVPGCAGPEGCCAPFCDLTDPDSDMTCGASYAAPGATCEPVFDPRNTPAGLEDVGLCVLAP